jgi:hypothetical protein
MTKVLHDVELSLGDVSVISGIHAKTLGLWATRGRQTDYLGSGAPA